MSIALAALLGTLGIVADGGTDVEKELKKFQGTWTFQSVEAGGKQIPAAQFKAMAVVFEGVKYSVKMGDKVVEAATLKLDPSQAPNAFESTVTVGPNKGAVFLGIYEFNGDTLKICFDPEGKKRPTQFKSGSGMQTLVVHQRVKK